MSLSLILLELCIQDSQLIYVRVEFGSLSYIGQVLQLDSLRSPAT